MTTTRSASVLIIVAGLCALLAVVATSFLVSMRSSGERNALLLRETQARLALVGACAFILEHSPKWEGHLGRLGPSGTLERDLLGPHDLYPVERPPYATIPRRVYSPLAAYEKKAGLGFIETFDHDRGTDVHTRWDIRPTYPRKDPTRYVGQTMNPGGPAYFADADDRPVQGAGGRAWFRCHHHSAGRFTVTVGAGGTGGYRDWSEVVAAGAVDRFGGDPSDPTLFDALRAEEVRHWYEVRWAPFSQQDIQGLPEFYDRDGDGSNDLYATVIDRADTALPDPSTAIDWADHASDDEYLDHQTFSRPGDAWRMFGRITSIRYLGATRPSGDDW